MNSAVHIDKLMASCYSLGGVMDYQKEEIERNQEVFGGYYNGENPLLVNFKSGLDGKLLEPYLKQFKKTSFDDLTLEEKSKVTQSLFEASRPKADQDKIKLYNKFNSNLAELKSLKKIDDSKLTKQQKTKIKNIKQYLTKNQSKYDSIKNNNNIRGANEFVFSVDKSISLAIAKLPKHLQDRAYETFHKSCNHAMEFISYQIDDNNKSKNKPEDQKAKVVTMGVTHLTNRDRAGHLHHHGVAFNFQQIGDKLMGTNVPMAGERFNQLTNLSALVFNAHFFSSLQADEELSKELSGIKFVDSQGKETKTIRDLETIKIDLIKGQSELDEFTLTTTAHIFIVKYQKHIDDFNARYEKERKIISDLFLSNSITKEEADERIFTTNRNQRRELDYLTSREFQTKFKNQQVRPDKQAGYSQEFLDLLNKLEFDKKQDFGTIQRTPIASTWNPLIGRFIEQYTDKICDEQNLNILTKDNFLPLAIEALPLSSYIEQLKERDRIINLVKHQFTEIDGNFIPNHIIRENLNTLSKLKQMAGETTSATSIDKSFIPSNIIFEKSQEKALEHGLSNNKLTLIRGVAGSGKSFVSTFIVEGHSTQNNTDNTDVNYILAPTNQAVKALEEAFKTNSDAGLISEETIKKTVFMTVNKFNLIQPELTKESLVLMDEAGMVSDAIYSKLTSRVAGAGCKTVLVGDQHQLQSVAPGSVFKSLMADPDTSQAKVVMNGIQRQKAGTVEHQLAQLISGANISEAEYERKILSNSLINEAFEFMEKNNFITFNDEKFSAKEKLVNAYFSDPNKPKDKIILAATNADVDDINKIIQSRIYFNNPNKIKIDETLDLYVGDQIIFKEKVKNDNTLIHNGDIATIKSFDKTTNQMVLHFNDGRTETINPFENKDKLALSYSLSVHKSQGQTKQEAYLYLSESKANTYQNLYVSLTRSKNKTKVFVEESKYNKIKESYKAKNQQEDIYKRAHTKYQADKVMEVERNNASTKVFEEQQKKASAIDQIKNLDLSKLFQPKFDRNKFIEENNLELIIDMVDTYYKDDMLMEWRRTNRTGQMVETVREIGKDIKRQFSNLGQFQLSIGDVMEKGKSFSPFHYYQAKSLLAIFSNNKFDDFNKSIGNNIDKQTLAEKAKEQVEHFEKMFVIETYEVDKTANNKFSDIKSPSKGLIEIFDMVSATMKITHDKQAINLFKENLDLGYMSSDKVSNIVSSIRDLKFDEAMKEIYIANFKIDEYKQFNDSSKILSDMNNFLSNQYFTEKEGRELSLFKDDKYINSLESNDIHYLGSNGKLLLENKEVVLLRISDIDSKLKEYEKKAKEQEPSKTLQKERPEFPDDLESPSKLKQIKQKIL